MTAKKTLIEFLKFWKRGNKKQMYSRTTKTWQSKYDKNAFQGTGLKSFEILSEKQNGAVADFSILLNNEPHSVRLICENAEYKADINGIWGVFPGSFRKVKDKSIELNNAINRDIGEIGTNERDKFEKKLEKEIKRELV